MTTERDIQRAILLACSHGPTRLFRNNVGLGWMGRVLSQTPDRIVLADPRPLHAGLHVGSGDLIGWHQGRFVSLEVKGPRGVVSEDQERWLAAVLEGGGLGGVVRSVEDARRVLRAAKRLEL